MSGGNEQLQQVLKNQQKQKRTQNDSEKHDEGIVQLVCFMVDDEEFAVPILSIQEIIKPMEATRVPSTPNYVVGVFNLRGNVLPLIDLRRKFGRSKSAYTDETRFIVIRNKNQVSGFVIDKLTEAIRLKESDIDPAPDGMESEENHIYGVGKREDSIITILRVEMLLKRNF
ncbi:MAG: chemotaxis protein CheW [Helicobacteraceae bacterium]|jgi:purine-binding chemotaxis protein CheW|nr:chemotaxis protein CheW [Helicobacteraceae bacterium]